MPYITSIEQLGIDKGRQEGLREGLRDGRQEGLRDGRQEGLREGRQEGLRAERLDVARRMLSMGSDRAFILRVSQLSEQELEALEKEQEPG